MRVKLYPARYGGWGFVTPSGQFIWTGSPKMVNDDIVVLYDSREVREAPDPVENSPGGYNPIATATTSSTPPLSPVVATTGINSNATIPVIDIDIDDADERENENESASGGEPSSSAELPSMSLPILVQPPPPRASQHLSIVASALKAKGKPPRRYKSGKLWALVVKEARKAEASRSEEEDKLCQGVIKEREEAQYQLTEDDRDQVTEENRDQVTEENRDQVAEDDPDQVAERDRSNSDKTGDSRGMKIQPPLPRRSQRLAIMSSVLKTKSKPLQRYKHSKTWSLIVKEAKKAEALRKKEDREKLRQLAIKEREDQEKLRQQAIKEREEARAKRAEVRARKLESVGRTNQREARVQVTGESEKEGQNRSNIESTGGTNTVAQTRGRPRRSGAEAWAMRQETGDTRVDVWCQRERRSPTGSRVNAWVMRRVSTRGMKTQPTTPRRSERVPIVSPAFRTMSVPLQRYKHSKTWSLIVKEAKNAEALRKKEDREKLRQLAIKQREEARAKRAEARSKKSESVDRSKGKEAQDTKENARDKMTRRSPRGSTVEAGDLTMNAKPREKNAGARARVNREKVRDTNEDTRYGRSRALGSLRGSPPKVCRYYL